jgi:UDP-N-acetyl-D-galactosamine dehydrogenase
MDIYDKLVKKETRLSVLGLGYVGLPLALAFARKLSVIALDQDEERISLLKKHTDPSHEMPPEAFQGCDIEFTSDASKLSSASFHIIAVPTPVDKKSIPDLNFLLTASRTVGQNLKRGDYVVYESTVYPGATEEDCVPLLSEASGLRYIDDFKVGYSPERINPGDREHTLSSVIKVVAACDRESLEKVLAVYRLIVLGGFHPTSSIKVAEAAKIIENTQRDVNIALINELSIIFNRMGINTYEVLEAAGTKWNFLKFNPGLVGGHCIGVDPYYLAYKAMQYNYYPHVIKAGRYVNDSMGFYVAKQTVKRMLASGWNVLNSKVLIMGITFKENVSDIRNTRVRDIVSELVSYGVKVEVYDPWASSVNVEKEFGFPLIGKPLGGYDAIIVAVAHDEFKELQEDYFIALSSPDALLVDVKGLYRGRIKRMGYWSL